MSRLSRRSVLAGLVLAGPMAQAQVPPVLLSRWGQWKARFLRSDGRVVDPGQGGITHSEGQAYALLLAQAFGDRDAFEAIELWTLRHLATRQDALMAWRWQDGEVRDWRNATDGDLLRGWALLRASRDSGWAGHAAKAQAIAGALVTICLAPDPRAPGEDLLKPADQSPASPTAVLVNPSYYLPRALRELSAAFDQPRLIRTADHGETLLRDPLALRDWITVTPAGVTPPEGHDNRFGWDGLRIPLYLVWSGRADHPAVRQAAARFALANAPGHVAVVTDAAGRVLSESDLAGFRAVAALAQDGAEGRLPAHALVDDATGSGEYYPDTLALLAALARAEGGAD
ncbi:glycosyl hydrolase family 5 [Cereibacter sphaeroides]|nr:glycosyl hydrolase family 5 [Cereibacter sphaeroides]